MGYFKKAKLIHQLNVQEEDADLIISLQKKFPETLAYNNSTDKKKPIFSARTLYTQLGYNLADNNFNRWMRKMIENEDAVKEKDYQIIWVKEGSVFKDGGSEPKTEQQLRGLGYEADYLISIRFAESIGMMTGTAPRTPQHIKENGKKIRRYFQIMAEIVQLYEEWTLIRHPEKEGAKHLRKTIREIWYAKRGCEAPSDVYAKEFDMLNEVLLGMTTRKLRAMLGVTQDELTRDHLDSEYNFALWEIQSIDEGLIVNNTPFSERRKHIKNFCQFKYPHLKVEKFFDFEIAE